MAKTYTQKEIERIDGDRVAIPGHFYSDEWGNVYIGTNGRRLRAYNGDSAVWGSITGDIEDQADLVNYLQQKLDQETLQAVTDRGNVTTQPIIANAHITDGGTGEDFTMGDGVLSDLKKKWVINAVAVGLRGGGNVTINATDPTRIDLEAGEGLIIDNYTDPDNPVIFPVSWEDMTNVKLDYISTNTKSFLMIDRNGSLIQQTDVPNGAEHRDYIVLSQVSHTNLTTIGAVSNYPEIAITPSSQLRDLMQAIGLINSGNIISPNGANLKIDKSFGTLTRSGINFYKDAKDPSVRDYAQVSAATFRRRTQIGLGANGVDTLDVGNYDVAGVITAIVGTRYQNMRVFLTIPGNLVIQYGQNTYNSMANAIQAIQTESFVIFDNLIDIAAFIGIITVRNTATDLSDSAQARFLIVSKFGETVGAAAGTSVTDLQGAYDNSITPEIVTDATRGAITFQVGSGSDTDDVFEVLNTVGAQTFAVNGNGKAYVGSETASRILSTNSGSEIEALDIATYPSLTELSYIKGLTGAVTTVGANIFKVANPSAIRYIRVNADNTVTLLSLEDLSDDLGVVTGNGLYIFLTGGDQTTTSASATAITDLVTPTLEVNSRYLVYGHVHLGCNNTGGTKLAIDVPASSSLYFNLFGRSSSITGALTQPLTADATLHGTAFNAFNNANGMVIINGEFTTDVTADVAQLMFASGTAGQTSTIYQEGTWLFIKKIA